MYFHFKKKIIFLSTFICFSVALSQQKVESRFDPTIQSFIFPGWGQKTLGYKNRSNMYFYAETAILVSLFSTNKFSNEIKRNYIAFAADHALVNKEGKDREFWVDIGNYNSINDYNNEHQRNRETSDLYPINSEWSWSWDTEKNRRYFELRRIQSDRLKLASTFAIGALVLNHIVSSIDALYLKRKSKFQKININAYNENEFEMGYKIEYVF